MTTFELSEDFVDSYKHKTIKWGYNGLGYVVYKRTYARQLANGKSEEWWQTVKRVVEGCYTIQREHCEQYKLPWNQRKAQQSAQKMYDLIFNFKFTPPGRGLWMMGTDYVKTNGSAALNNCLEYNTELITVQGIKKIGDCVGTTQTILTEGGKWVEAPISSFGKQKLSKIILTRAGIEKEIYATEDHRWFVQDRRKAYRNKGWIEVHTKDLRPNKHRLQSVFGQGIKSIRPSSFGIIQGFTYGDGTRVTGEKNANRLVLCGTKDLALLKYFGNCHTTKIKTGLVIHDIPNSFKELPLIRENKSFLYGWLAGYFAADGHCSKKGSCSITSYNKESLEFVRDVCYVLGIGTFGITTTTSISNLDNKQHTKYRITLMRDTLSEDFFLIEAHKNNYISNKEVIKQHWTVKSVEQTSRVEEVYCATVEGYGKFALADNILTGNCSFVSTENINIDFAEPFCFLMDMSMLGVGVGSDVRGQGKVKIQKPVEENITFVVADTREGWVELLRRTLSSYVGENKIYKDVDYSLVRPAGTPIKGFGGVASGAEPLKEMIKDVRAILDRRVGSYIASDDIVDIFNLIGKCVVAGNVRRTAEIMFGEPTDELFMGLKDPEKNKDALYHHRWASNNSIFASVGMDYTKVADMTAKNGEPGYVWLDNMQKYSRIKIAPDYKDMNVKGSNPCCEQSLESYECCNLVETYPSNHESLEEWTTTLKFAYLYAKTVTLVPTHNQLTNSVMLKNRRIGCSISGITQAFKKFGRRNFLDSCNTGYDKIQTWDKQFSEWLCIPRSIKTTSVKPSGTVSLLAGVTPGIHYPVSEYYVRNVRFASNSELLKQLKEAGYKVEKDSYGTDSMVVSFPIKEEYFDRSVKEVTMWEQFENAAQMQHFWSDNQVSVTITFNQSEGKDIKNALELYETRLKGVSLLPSTDAGYEQAPYIPITKEKYESMIEDIEKLKIKGNVNEVQERGCDSGTCALDFSILDKKEATK